MKRPYKLDKAIHFCLRTFFCAIRNTFCSIWSDFRSRILFIPFVTFLFKLEQILLANIFCSLQHFWFVCTFSKTWKHQQHSLFRSCEWYSRSKVMKFLPRSIYLNMKYLHSICFWCITFYKMKKNENCKDAESTNHFCQLINPFCLSDSFIKYCLCNMIITRHAKTAKKR